MSDNNINTAVDGTIIQAADVNQYKTALGGDIVRRNVSGVPTSSAGSLGTSLLSWVNGWFTKLFSPKIVVGDTEDTSPDIRSTTNDIRYRTHNLKKHYFEVDGNIKTVIDNDGLEGGYIKASSIVNASITDGTIGVEKLANRNYATGAVSAGGGGTATISTVNITLTGRRPVGVNIPDDFSNSSASGVLTVKVFRGAVLLAEHNFLAAGSDAGRSISCIDAAPPAGVNSYTVQMGGTGSLFITSTMSVVEL